MITGLNCTEAVTLARSDRQRVFGMIKDTGVNDVRLEIPWELVGATASSVAGLATADATIADAHSAGLDVLAMIAHPPPSATPPASVLEGVMTVLTERYPEVGAWEVWNEENSQNFWPKGSAATFFPYLQAAYAGVKRGNPTAQVVLGGLAACASASRQWYQFWVPPYTNVDPIAFLTALYALGGGAFFDVLALHPYAIDSGYRELNFANTDPYVIELPEAIAVMAKNGDGAKKVWATEYGWRVTGTTFTAAAQATNLIEELDYLETVPAVERAYIYNGRDYGTTTYGIYDKNNVPRPAVAALKKQLAA